MARRRRRNSDAEDLVLVLAQLPWQACVAAAFISFLVLHWMSQPSPVVHAGKASDLASTAVGGLVQILAFFGQFLIPLVCLVAAALSALREAEKRRNAAQVSAPVIPLRVPKNWDADRDRRAADLRNAMNAAQTRSAAPDSLDRAEDVERLLDLIEWRRFEALVERVYQLRGFSTSSQAHGADGGVDVKLYGADAPDTLAAVIQCKHWGSRQIGVELLRELRGSMAACNAPQGYFVTSSTFTSVAAAFAAANQIQIVDRRSLIAEILAFTPQQRASIRTTALSGDYMVPTCASCGTKMVKRPGRKYGSAFWGCTNFPRCRSVIQIARDAT